MKMFRAFILIINAIGICHASPSSTKYERKPQQQYTDSLLSMVPTQIDSVLTINFQRLKLQSNENSDSVKSTYWSSTDVNGVAYLVNKLHDSTADCIKSEMQLKKFYKSTLSQFLREMGKTKLRGRDQFENYGVQIAALTYEFFDPEWGENGATILHDSRFITIGKYTYHILIAQELESLDRSKNDAFFNSIKINKIYKGKGQFSGCTVEASNTDQGENIAYGIGSAIGAALCFVIPIAILILAVVLIVRYNRRKKKNMMGESADF